MDTQEEILEIKTEDLKELNIEELVDVKIELNDMLLKVNELLEEE